MPGLEEGTTVWRYRVADPSRFDRFRVKDITDGVKITLGRVKGSERWEVENYLFEKQRFKNRDMVLKWLDEHLKAEIKTLLDWKAWNETRKRLLSAYLKISEVK